jgi:PAS domain S-box-containing protein
MATFALGGVALAAMAMVFLAFEVDRKIGALATANSDSTQWSLAQAEVELLALQTSLLIAEDDPESSLSDVRRRFDVFYSRIGTIAQSPTYAPLLDLTGLPESLGRVEGFLSGAVPAIDGPDEDLRAALGSLAAEAGAIRDDLRLLSLSGISVFSSQADAERDSIARLLLWVSAVALSIFLGLLVAVGLLLLANRGARRRAQEQELLRARLESIVATSLDAVLLVGRDGRILEFNGAAENVFGYTRAEAIGAPMAEMIVPDHFRAAHNAGMKRYEETGERHVIGKGRIKIEARRKSGEVFPVELSIATAQSSEGEVFVSFIRDISHRVAAEREVIAARDRAVAGEKAKAELLAVMSHEIRTPLNGMLGTLELLDTVHLTDKQKRYVEIIRASGNLLLHHVNDVLQISRADAGKLGVVSEPFALSALVTELVESQRGSAEHRGDTLVTRLGAGADGWVSGDPTRIRQVLLNLLGNAIKFTRNGAIEVAVERIAEADAVEFRVSDTGIGVPAADRERIFEDFVTLDTSYARSAGGTGLGLAIARRLVRAMGGEIGVDESPDGGASFFFRIPLPPAEMAGAGSGSDEADAAAPTSGRRRILVVEDNSINRIVVREMLEREGHEVEEAHDGQEGVAMATRRTYDLVLMDISMPVLDGVEATRMIRAAEGAHRHVPIVALTAHALPEEMDRFRAAGLDDILVKPISRATLASVLERSARDDPHTGADEADALPPPGADVIERAQLDELRQSLGDERTSRLVAMFVQETDAVVAEITDPTRPAGNGREIRDKVHRLAGSAAVLGAGALRTCLSEIETLLLEQSRLDRTDAEALAIAWKNTRRTLEAYRGEVGSFTSQSERPETPQAPGAA